MNWPLENNHWEPAEVPSKGVFASWPCYFSVTCKCKSIILWKTLPWKQMQEMGRSLGRIWPLPLQQGQSDDGPHRLSTQEGRELLAAILCSALWLAEGRFHHPATLWLVHAQSPGQHLIGLSTAFTGLGSFDFRCDFFFFAKWHSDQFTRWICL